MNTNIPYCDIVDCISILRKVYNHVLCSIPHATIEYSYLNKNANENIKELIFVTNIYIFQRTALIRVLRLMELNQAPMVTETRFRSRVMIHLLW